MRRLLVPVALVLFVSAVASVAANVIRVVDFTKEYETRPRMLVLSGGSVNLVHAALLLGAALLLILAVELDARTEWCDRAIGAGLAIALVAAVVPIYASVAPGNAASGQFAAPDSPTATERVTSFLAGGSIVLVAGCAAVILWLLMTSRIGPERLEEEPEAEEVAELPDATPTLPDASM